MLLKSYVNSCYVKMLSICYKWIEIFFVVEWKSYQSRMCMHLWKELLHKLEKVERVGKNAKIHIFTFGSWRFMWIHNLHPKSFFSKRSWSSKMSSINVIHDKHFFCGEKFLAYKHNLWNFFLKTILSPMIMYYVLNQTWRYWLFFDEIIITISMCCMMNPWTNDPM